MRNIPTDATEADVMTLSADIESVFFFRQKKNRHKGYVSVLYIAIPWFGATP